MDPGLVVSELLRRRGGITAADKKILMNIVQQEAPELLQPSTVKRLPRGIWGKITAKFNKDTNSARNVRELKGCIQNIMRKAIQRKSGINNQLLTCGASNFTPYEKSLVVSLVKSNIIVLSKLKDSETQKDKRRAWAAIMWAFNKTPGIDCQRTAMEIKTCLMNLTNRSDRRDVQELRQMITTPDLLGPNKSMSLGRKKFHQGQGTGLAQGLKSRMLLPKQHEAQNTHTSQPPPYSSAPHTASMMQTSQSQYTQQPNTMPIHTITSVSAPRVSQLHATSSLQTVPPPPPMPQVLFAQNPSQLAPPTPALRSPVNTLPGTGGHVITAGSDVPVEDEDTVIEIKEESSPGSAGVECTEASTAPVGRGQTELGAPAREINTVPGNLIQLEKVMPQGHETAGGQYTEESGDSDGLNNVQIRVHREGALQESLPRMRSPPQTITTSTRRISSPIRAHMSPPAAPDRTAAVTAEHGAAGTSSGVTDWLGSSEQHQYQNTHEDSRHMFQSTLAASTALDDSVLLDDDPAYGDTSGLGSSTFINRTSSHTSRDRLLNRGNHSRRDAVQEPKTSFPRRRSKVSQGRESLGKLKRRLVQEEHDLKVSLMREQHAWLLEEHMWKNQEHELRMNMIRMNSKF